MEGVVRRNLWDQSAGAMPGAGGFETVRSALLSARDPIVPLLRFFSFFQERHFPSVSLPLRSLFLYTLFFPSQCSLPAVNGSAHRRYRAAAGTAGYHRSPCRGHGAMRPICLNCLNVPFPLLAACIPHPKLLLCQIICGFGHSFINFYMSKLLFTGG